MRRLKEIFDRVIGRSLKEAEHVAEMPGGQQDKLLAGISEQERPAYEVAIRRHGDDRFYIGGIEPGLKHHDYSAALYYKGSDDGAKEFWKTFDAEREPLKAHGLTVREFRAITVPDWINEASAYHRSRDPGDLADTPLAPTDRGIQDSADYHRMVGGSAEVAPVSKQELGVRELGADDHEMGM